MSNDLVEMARLAQHDERMATGALYGDLADRIEELEAKLAQQDDLVQAAVAAALREAAESLHTVVNRKGSNDYRRGHQGYSNGIDACYDAILDLITDDAQDALGRVAAAERERCAIVAHEAWVYGIPIAEIPACIREGGKDE